MADLYTSLVRAKQELNGGTLPAMTPVPENVQHLVDPTLTPGLGALEESESKGLRCPVKGCGKYFQSLRQHLDKAHSDLGGADAVVDALQIPPTAKLVSQRLRSHFRERTKARVRSGELKGTTKGITDARRRAGHKTTRGAARSMGHRNLRNTCEAQIAQRLVSLEQRLGRSPTAREAYACGEASLVSACKRLYGTWNAAKAAVGLKCHAVRGSERARREAVKDARDDIAEMFAAYFSEHGRMPSEEDVSRGDSLPLLPPLGIVRLRFPDVEWSTLMGRFRSRAAQTAA